MTRHYPDRSPTVLTFLNLCILFLSVGRTSRNKIIIWRQQKADWKRMQRPRVGQRNQGDGTAKEHKAKWYEKKRENTEQEIKQQSKPVVGRLGRNVARSLIRQDTSQPEADITQNCSLLRQVSARKPSSVGSAIRSEWRLVPWNSSE